jgi:hypothetical protein
VSYIDGVATSNLLHGYTLATPPQQTCQAPPPGSPCEQNTPTFIGKNMMSEEMFAKSLDLDPAADEKLSSKLYSCATAQGYLHADV